MCLKKWKKGIARVIGAGNKGSFRSFVGTMSRERAALIVSADRSLCLQREELALCLLFAF